MIGLDCVGANSNLTQCMCIFCLHTYIRCKFIFIKCYLGIYTIFFLKLRDLGFNFLKCRLEFNLARPKLFWIEVSSFDEDYDHNLFHAEKRVCRNDILF